MNITEHLLTIVSEECSEIAKNVAKAQRFGLKDHEPGNLINNSERIMEEFYDLMAVIEKCQNHNILSEWTPGRIDFHKSAKKLKVEKYIEYAREAGTLDKIV